LRLQPGRRERLGDQLYGQILQQIVDGTLSEGDRLPSELEICALFGVSRPIVREALLRLRADGLLQARPGVGTFVMKRPSDQVTRLAESGDLAGYLRCVEARMPLEGAAARLAAERRTDEDLARIEATHNAFSRAIRSREASANVDLAFHASVADATHNELFSKVLEELRDAVGGFMNVSLGLTSGGSEARLRRVEEEHARIVEAIRIQDGEAAQLAMQYHIAQARLRVLDRTRDI
jgi:GntR family transcriptional repressor for pyruvate dehydrogenase complex